jgi:hypothetical protein
VQFDGHGGGHCRGCFLQFSGQGLILWYLAPHACGSVQPWCQVCRWRQAESINEQLAALRRVSGDNGHARDEENVHGAQPTGRT